MERTRDDAEVSDAFPEVSQTPLKDINVQRPTRMRTSVEMPKGMLPINTTRHPMDFLECFSTKLVLRLNRNWMSDIGTVVGIAICNDGIDARKHESLTPPYL